MLGFEAEAEAFYVRGTFAGQFAVEEIAGVKLHRRFRGEHFHDAPAFRLMHGGKFAHPLFC